MCQFFSFITYKGKKYYFDFTARETENTPDSHSRIAEVFLGSTLKEDDCNKYEYANGKLIADSVTDKEECFEDVKDWADNFVVSKEYARIATLAFIKGKAPFEGVPKQYQDTARNIAVKYACQCAERVLKVYEDKYPEDKRVRKAIEVTRLFMKGEATKEELIKARDAAYAAYAAAYAAANAAAYAANAAACAANAAAYAAYAAAYAAANAAAYATNVAAYAAANAAAYAAAYAAEKEAQHTILINLINQNV